MNKSVLDQKLRALKLYPRLPAAEIDRLGALLPTLGPWDLQKINPLAFAELHGFDVDVLLDLLIHGAKNRAVRLSLWADLPFVRRKRAQSYPAGRHRHRADSLHDVFTGARSFDG